MAALEQMALWLISGWGLGDPGPACHLTSEESEAVGRCVWPKVTWWLGTGLCAL